MNWRYYSLETPKSHVDAITHVYCYVENYVLTMQLPHSTALHMKMETQFSVHNCTCPTWKKATLESEHNSHENKMVPTTNSILTQRQVGCW